MKKKKRLNSALVTALPSITEVQRLSEQHARTLALQNLGFETTRGMLRSDYTAASIYGEALRNALWALSDRGKEPVYVTRLLHAAERLVAPGILPPGLVLTVPGTNTQDPRRQTLDTLREVLEQLETIGDMAGLPRGRWLPAPLRGVHLEAMGKWILLGGIPTSRLGTITGRKVEYGDVARFLSSDPHSVGLEAGVETLEEWYRRPTKDLRSWTEGVLDGTRLLPFEDSEAKFECYVPKPLTHRWQQNELQYNRWENNGRLVPAGRQLVRRLGMYDSARFSIAQVEKGIVVATGTPDLGQGDIRRLMYGLDLLAERPVKVEIQKNQTKAVVVLRNELPGPERRLFMALGRLLPNEDGRYYPRRWEMAPSYATEAKAALEVLGVEVISL